MFVTMCHGNARSDAVTYLRRRWCKTVMALVLSWFTVIAPTAAQADGMAGRERPVMELGIRHTLWSETLQEGRPLEIYLPPNYERRGYGYPVLYLLDGDRNFLQAVAAVQFLAEGGRIPETIVVAIPNLNRGRDLTPTSPACAEADVPAPDCGGGARFRRFLVDELMPWVESEFRTVPFRTLVGHSRGGLFAFDTLLNEPDAFNAYIAASPALWWGKLAVLEGAEGKLKRLPPHRFLYFADGNESEYITKTVPVAVDLLKREKPKRLEWHYEHLGGDEHMTTPHRTLYNGLEKIFAGLQVPHAVIREQGLKGIDAHYAGLAERYGYPVRLPMGMLDWMGYYLLQQQKPEMAIEVFRRSVALYPNAHWPYASLARAYTESGLKEEAIHAWEDAYKHAVGW